MVRGIRPRATIINPAVQPASQYLYDPITRRAVRYVETIVPTVAPGSGGNTSTSGQGIPADRYYCDFGCLRTATTLPAEWAGTIGLSGGGSGNNWDSTIKRRYVILSASGDQIGNGPHIFWPTGFAGEATTYAPKNATVTSLWLKVTAKFPTNADYTTGGIGLALTGNSGSVFNTAGSQQGIQMTRNAGSWELGSSDGTTVSQSSGGSADGNWHEFWLKWTESDMTMYVDGTSTITKSTNMPSQTLAFAALADTAGGNDIWISDALIYWE